MQDQYFSAESKTKILVSYFNDNNRIINVIGKKKIT